MTEKTGGLLASPSYWKLLSGKEKVAEYTAEPTAYTNRSVAGDSGEFGGGDGGEIGRNGGGFSGGNGGDLVSKDEGRVDGEVGKQNQYLGLKKGWWFWSGSEDVAGGLERGNQGGISGQKVVQNENVPGDGPLGENGEWLQPYLKITSVFSYIYKSDEGEGSGSQSGDRVVEGGNGVVESGNKGGNKGGGALADANAPPPPQSQDSGLNAKPWYSWFWSDNVTGSASSEDASEPELFRSARNAIENAKDSSHYAFKSSVDGQNHLHEFELAVSDTVTETQPVRHTSRKRPVIPNEVRENSILYLDAKVEPVATTSNSNKAPPPTIPRTAGSLTSIKDQLQDGSSKKRFQATPHVNETYRPITTVTYLRLLGEHWIYRHHSSETHLYKLLSSQINKRRQRIKRVVIVGVHGFLPIKMVKTLIGLSTGNSLKYVKYASEAVQQWLNETDNGVEHDIQTIALEGEGLIEDRVEKLYFLLKNWSEQLDNCDFLFFVSHSVGSPVAVHLLARLLSQRPGLRRKKKIGLLSMAGMLLGPLAGLDSKVILRAHTQVENEIIKELFEYQKPKSAQSLALTESFKILCHHNVKVSLSGPLNDQWIPLYSSLALHLHHPNIHRFFTTDTDGDIPKFVVSLVRLATIMYNLGLSDQHIVGDLSEKCMGPLATGGHCKIYKDSLVYLMAITHSLETTSLVQPRDLQLHLPAYNIHHSKHQVSNMYNLPWNVRGLINDLVKVKNLPSLHLVVALLADYKQWSDQTPRKWKDLKFCLGAFEELDLNDIFL